MYEAYSLVGNYLVDKLENGDSLSDMWIAIQQYNAITEKLLLWKEAKTSDIEKQLKKSKSPEEKLNVFLAADS